MALAENPYRTEDLSPAVCDTGPVRQNDCEAERGFIATLTRDISLALPTLKAGVNILLEGDLSHYQTKDNVLRGHVCGRAARVLGYLLRRQGYQAEGRSTQFLGEYYPTVDHALLVVKDPAFDTPVVVDAAYQQFLRGFRLDDDNLPPEEVLILSGKAIQEKAEEFARLRDLRLSTHPNPWVFENSHLFQLPHQQLVSYFERIWRIDNYPDRSSNLEEDIERYKHDPSSVSNLTRKLIQQLGF
jgi:hypothetical protein